MGSVRILDGFCAFLQENTDESFRYDPSGHEGLEKETSSADLIITDVISREADHHETGPDGTRPQVAPRCSRDLSREGSDRVHVYL